MSCLECRRRLILVVRDHFYAFGITGGRCTCNPLSANFGKSSFRIRQSILWIVHSGNLLTEITKSPGFMFSMIKTWGKTSMVAFESERLTQSWKSLSKHDFPVDRFCSTEGFPNLGHPSDRIELILVFPHVFWHVSAGIQYFCNPFFWRQLL